MKTSAGGGSEILTPIELRLALMVANGWTNARIAKELNLAVPTIKNKLGEVYRKMCIRNDENQRVSLAVEIQRKEAKSTQ